MLMHGEFLSTYNKNQWMEIWSMQIQHASSMADMRAIDKGR